MKKYECNVEGCELHHCKRCGGHYDPYAAYGSSICDECQINAAAEECERVIEAFGGNSEEAARVMGWQ